MIKGSKKIIEQGATSTPEVQPIAFKATKEKKEESTSSRLPINASKLDNEDIGSSSGAFAKSSSKGGGRTTSPAPRKFATSVVSPVILLQNVHYHVIVTGATTRREREEKRRDITRRRAAMPMFTESGTPTRAPPTPPPTRTPQTSLSPKAFSSPTSATSASWQRMARRRR
jgi:hypothetical protein